MVHKRYDTPNHPRWDERTTDSQSADAPSRWLSGRARSRSRTERATLAAGEPAPPVTLSEADDAPIKLVDGPNWVRITAELSGRSLDDVRVAAAGTAIRILAEPSESAASSEPSDRSDGIDRTITLSGTAVPDEAVVAYCDPALNVLVLKRDAR